MELEEEEEEEEEGGDTFSAGTLFLAKSDFPEDCCCPTSLLIWFVEGSLDKPPSLDLSDQTSLETVVGCAREVDEEEELTTEEASSVVEVVTPPAVIVATAATALMVGGWEGGGGGGGGVGDLEN